MTESNGPQKPLRKPDWIRVKAPNQSAHGQIRKLMRRQGLHTVCEEASCPNIGECWGHKVATFLIMGGICTRNCAFCNVQKGKPMPIDENEPDKVAKSAAEMALKHVVVTSVDRDDLADGGAAHFAQTTAAIRKALPEATIELLTPDFKNKPGALQTVLSASPDVFNHNLETVPRLYKPVRPVADYGYSLGVLKTAAEETGDEVFTKSGIMVGLGETDDEVLAVMDDLRAAKVDFITIGQYLCPSRDHVPVERYVPPETFSMYTEKAYEKGFLMVSAHPLTRSSHHAGADFEKLKAARAAKAG